MSKREFIQVALEGLLYRKDGEILLALTSSCLTCRHDSYYSSHVLWECVRHRSQACITDIGSSVLLLGGGSFRCIAASEAGT